MNVELKEGTEYCIVAVSEYEELKTEIDRLREDKALHVTHTYDPAISDNSYGYIVESRLSWIALGIKGPDNVRSMVDTLNAGLDELRVRTMKHQEAVKQYDNSKEEFNALPWYKKMFYKF